MLKPIFGFDVGIVITEVGAKGIILFLNQQMSQNLFPALDVLRQSSLALVGRKHSNSNTVSSSNAKLSS